MKEIIREYEGIKSPEDLTLKQRAQLLRIGCVTKSRNLLGKNGQRLYAALCGEIYGDQDKKSP